jgi:hypothetical protein
MALITRLNPPQLNTKLPAFTYSESKAGSALTIPFNLNHSVAKS